VRLDKDARGLVLHATFRLRRAPCPWLERITTMNRILLFVTLLPTTLVGCSGTGLVVADRGEGGATPVGSGSVPTPTQPVSNADDASNPIPNPQGGNATDASTLATEASTVSTGTPQDADLGGTDLDASVGPGTVQAPPAPAGFAGFAFVVDGVVQTPMSCPAANWEFPTPSEEGCAGGFPMDGSCKSVLIVNTGALTMPYVAQTLWNTGAHAVPGVLTGDSNQLAGVLEPGQQVDITSVYAGGFVAVLGSSEPFSDGSRYVSDEGKIPWPAGVGGQQATDMYVAEIEIRMGFTWSDGATTGTSCTGATQLW
jgi:hypothetical protein